jgi:hypothetical protein
MLTAFLDCPCTITYKPHPPYTTTTTYYLNTTTTYCPPESTPSKPPHTYYNSTSTVVTVTPPPETIISGTSSVTPTKTPVAPSTSKPAIVTAAAQKISGSVGGLVVAGIVALMI